MATKCIIAGPFEFAKPKSIEDQMLKAKTNQKIYTKREIHTL